MCRTIFRVEILQYICCTVLLIYWLCSYLDLCLFRFVWLQSWIWFLGLFEMSSLVLVPQPCYCQWEILSWWYWNCNRFNADAMLSSVCGKNQLSYPQHDQMFRGKISPAAFGEFCQLSCSIGSHRVNQGFLSIWEAIWIHFQRAFSEPIQQVFIGWGIVALGSFTYRVACLWET